MKKLSSIIATINRPLLLQQLVEKLAQGRKRIWTMPTDIGRWSMAATSTVETYTDGCLTLKGESDSLSMTFSAPFLFTCIDKETHGCALAWSQSLN